MISKKAIMRKKRTLKGAATMQKINAFFLVAAGFSLR